MCGASSVLFFDTDQQRYTKKYIHPEPTEEFYCLAWTVLKGPKDMLDERVPLDAYTTLLAVAGRLGSIKLILPQQNECYQYMFGHTDSVTRLSFSQRHPRWLFSSSRDKTIRLWDIGSSQSDKNTYKCLCVFQIPAKYEVPVSLSVNYEVSTLFVGYTSGTMALFTIPKKNTKQWRALDLKEIDKEEERPMIIKTTRILKSGKEWHEGHVDEVYSLGSSRTNSTDPLKSRVISRGLYDNEIILWNPMTSTQEDADISKALAWPCSPLELNTRFKVIERHDKRVLVGGTAEGKIHVFNINDGRQSQTLEGGIKEQFQPIKTLSNADCTDVIRDVCISYDGKTLVAVSANNKTYLWKIQEETVL
ncbi:WD40-repeat-containing domain protein [Spinellus fusiger]|nr:WD40-repeat-containing domain protein [Spinellus fusiger]